MQVLAYIDPGSGAMIWQVIVAACVGVLFYFKKFRDALVRGCRRLIGRAEPPPAETASKKSDPA